jgi:hypothetical protein
LKLVSYLTLEPAMTPIDPDVAKAVRAALGFPAGDEPADLVAAARVLAAADRSAAMDGESVILTAVRLIWGCKMGGGTAQDARAAIADTWTLGTSRDVLAAMSAAWASVPQLQQAAAIGPGLP